MKLDVPSQNSQISNLASDHATSSLRLHTGTAPTTQGGTLGPVAVTHAIEGFDEPSNGEVLANPIDPATYTGNGTVSHASITNGTQTLLLSTGLAGSGAEVIVGSLTASVGIASNVISLTLKQNSGW